MFSPAYEIVKADGGVTALLGSPPRFYSFGDAPQDGSKPYAVQQVVSGFPENYLNQTPDTDSVVVQIDVYAQAPQDAKAICLALANALEPVSHITNWNGQFRDSETRLWRISFTVEFKTPR